MNKQLKWIIPALALVLVLGGTAVLYPRLSERFKADRESAAASETQVELTEMPDAAGADAEPGTFVTTEAYVERETTNVEQKPYDSTTTTAVHQPYETTTQSAPPADLATDFVVYDGSGNPVRLSDHFGKPIVVNFWASWCGPCCSELPHFDAAAEAYDGQIDFMMVNLTDGYSETVSSVKSFVADNGYSFPVYYDTSENAANAYSIYSIPLTVFIRADGTVMDSHVGSMDSYTLQNYLARLTA